MSEQPPHSIELEVTGEELPLIRNLLNRIKLTADITRFRLEVQSNSPLLSEATETPAETNQTSDDETHAEIEATSEEASEEASEDDKDLSQFAVGDKVTTDEKGTGEITKLTEYGTAVVRFDDGSMTGMKPGDLSRVESSKPQVVEPEPEKEASDEIDEEDEPDPAEGITVDCPICGETQDSDFGLRGHVNNKFSVCDYNDEVAEAIEDYRQRVEKATNEARGIESDEQDEKEPTPAQIARAYEAMKSENPEVSAKEFCDCIITEGTNKYKVAGTLATTQGRLELGALDEITDAGDFDIGYKSLSATLSKMKAEGLIDKSDKGYQLTEMGRDLFFEIHDSTPGSDLHRFGTNPDPQEASEVSA